jgi:hypothetical protein
VNILGRCGRFSLGFVVEVALQMAEALHFMHGVQQEKGCVSSGTRAFWTSLISISLAPLQASHVRVLSPFCSSYFHPLFLAGPRIDIPKIIIPANIMLTKENGKLVFKLSETWSTRTMVTCINVGWTLAFLKLRQPST